MIKNYRPISILNGMAKIYEKVIHKRLKKFLLDKHKVIPDNQYAYQENKSTTDAIIKLNDNINKALNDGKMYAACTIDYCKAFDTVKHNILLKKLEKMGIRGTAKELLKSYLSERQQYVEINGDKSEKKEIKAGIPQGATLCFTLVT